MISNCILARIWPVSIQCQALLPVPGGRNAAIAVTAIQPAGPVRTGPGRGAAFVLDRAGRWRRSRSRWLNWSGTPLRYLSRSYCPVQPDSFAWHESGWRDRRAVAPFISSHAWRAAAARHRSGRAGAGCVVQASRRRTLRRAAQAVGERVAAAAEQPEAAADRRWMPAADRTAAVETRAADIEDDRRRIEQLRIDRCRIDRLRIDRPGRRRIRRIGRSGVGADVIEHADETVPQSGKHRIGVPHARFRRHGIGDVPGEACEQQAQDLRIALVERRVEDRTDLGGESGICLRGERGRDAAWAWRAADGRGLAQAEAAPIRDPVGVGWRRRRNRSSFGHPTRDTRAPRCECGRRRRAAGRLRVRTGPRREPGTQAAGEADAAGKGAAHRAAEAADNARTDPLAGLGNKAGGVRRGWHWRGLYTETPPDGKENIS